MSLILLAHVVPPPPPEPEPEPEPVVDEDCVTPVLVADTAVVPAFTAECE